MIELNKLQYFHAVVKHGGITKGAEAMSICQPCMSLTLDKLEEWLGCRVIERGAGGRRRKCKPTEAGKIIYEAIDKAIAMTSEAIKKGKEL